MKYRTKLFVLYTIFVSVLATNINAQVTIGSGERPDESALLDLKEQADGTSHKGFLGPRVSLQSMTDQQTIPNPAAGLLVFNTGRGGLNYTGYVYWNGSEWRSLNSASLAAGKVGSITCNAIQLTPSVYQAGVAFEGTMLVPYVGGNGGVYEAQTIGPVNGLTATLPAGNFSVGAGSLAYTITGAPTEATPVVTTFPLEIGGQICQATVGAGSGIAPGDLVFFKSPEIPANIGSGDKNLGNVANCWISYWATQDNLEMPILGGKLRVDGYFYSEVLGSGTVTFQPRLVNISSQNVKIWVSAMSTAENFNDANVVVGQGAWVNLDNGVLNGYGENSILTSPSNGSNSYYNLSSGKTEVMTMDFSLDEKWYRVYYFPIVDNKDQITPSGMKRKVFISIQRLY